MGKLSNGEVLSRVLESLGWSEVDLSLSMRRTPEEIRMVIQGVVELDDGFKEDLEMILGVPSESWVGR